MATKKKQGSPLKFAVEITTIPHSRNHGYRVFAVPAPGSGQRRQLIAFAQRSSGKTLVDRLSEVLHGLLD